MNINLGEILEKHGFKGLIFVVLFYLLISLSKSKSLIALWDKLIDRKFKDKVGKSKITESNIINHDIFDYINLWKYTVIPTIKFSSDYRTIVFRKYLSIFLSSYSKKTKEFILSGSYKKMDNSELWKNIINLNNMIIYDYEETCRKDGVPEIIISKMKERNIDSIKLTIDLIESVTNSEFYESENNYLKIYSYLNIMLSILERTISNSENVCNSINGQLSGLIFTENGIEYREP